ncbi:hypothetical protein RJT34_27122 [Clitoria ternatea]|uniref:Peptidase A1 domain-containing protein n=1 Tax=Clitoria ternatea TaxID=43366 RepID=A0AAN9F9P1_CLITE
MSMHAFVFFLSVSCSLFSITLAEANNNSKGFSIDLIHRDSPLSPYYKPEVTPLERIKNAAMRSISRSNRISSLSLDQNKWPEASLIPDNFEYLMRFSIGTPPVERLAIADTGSDLIWVQCSPCQSCFPQDAPLFDPKSSSTFTASSCDSQSCSLLLPAQHRSSTCSSYSGCIYSYQYGDKSFTVGLLGTESLTFASMGGTQNVTFPNSIFGCGMYNDFTFPDGKITGLVGLGAGPLSLVSQIGDHIGHKFSYCLVPFDSNSTSKLKFGDEAVITGNGVVFTPLIIKPSFPTFYFLNLEGISIGEKTVQTGHTDGNIIIDSGTVMTYLEEGFYDNFVTSLQETLSVEAVQDVPYPFKFCFPSQPDMSFPNVVFQFTGASVSLGPQHVLLRITDANITCLTVVPTPFTGISLFGNLAQINFQVEYDLEGKRVSFAPTDCTKT